MKWIVGMDLRPYGAGAIHFAAWLAKASRASDGEQLFPVHVLEDEHLRFVLRQHHLDEVTGSAREAARASLETTGAPAAFEAPNLVVGGCAEDGLAAACKERHAQGIIIGRMAKREGHALVRLGTVARRLLHALPVPVVVVPPDVQLALPGTGPIVALTALHEGASACRFAEELARRTARELVIAHVVAPPEDLSYVLPPTLERIGRERREEAERALAGWVRSHELVPGSTRVLEGTLLETTLGFAREHSAPLLVVGAPAASRRAWIPSFARELAANAPTPVVVVPEPE
jgi:nucleotide-binding universal stress UspA family protein